MSFSEWLQKRMTEEAITQVELSEQTGLPQSRISEFSRGKREPKLSQIQALVNRLGCFTIRPVD